MKTLGVIALVGACAGAGYIIGREVGKTKKEKQDYGQTGFFIGTGIGILGAALYYYYSKNKPNTINYTLHHRRKRVYDGVCYEHRLNTRMNEHMRSGKIFDKTTFDNPKPRHVALNLERNFIQRFKPKYNIHHNCSA